MKTTISILLIAVLFSVVPAAAQPGFGIKGGLNLTTLNVEDPEMSYNSRTGYHAGLFLRGKFGKIGIQPELLLFTQNGDLESSIFGTAQERFTYLSIPVMLKFYPIGGLNLQVGPQFGFLLDGERKYDTFLGSGSQDITEYYKESDVSVSVGGGYDFDFGLSLDVRYNIGVKDINNVSNGEEARSRIFLLSLGWNFLH
ncbi:MAG: porin family protein [Cyclobacteriaceae bacterium]